MARFILIVFASVVLVGNSIEGQSASADEAQIRAAMVFNLTKYVDWPARKFIDSSMPFVICFTPKDPVGDYMEVLARDRQAHDKQGQDRSIVVRRIASMAKIDTCHVLYASRADQTKLADVLPELAKAAVLTISDRQASTNSYAISLPLVDNRVQIVVNLHVTQQSGLTLSSRLLKIATVTR